jgi:hypothetical protein
VDLKLDTVPDNLEVELTYIAAGHTASGSSACLSGDLLLGDYGKACLWMSPTDHAIVQIDDPYAVLARRMPHQVHNVLGADCII